MKSAVCLFVCLFVCYLPFLVHRVNTVWSGKRFCSKFSFDKWRFTNLKILLHVVDCTLELFYFWGGVNMILTHPLHNLNCGGLFLRQMSCLVSLQGSGWLAG